jgi:hypothetical protein
MTTDCSLLTAIISADVGSPLRSYLFSIDNLLYRNSLFLNYFSSLSPTYLFSIFQFFKFSTGDSSGGVKTETEKLLESEYAGVKLQSETVNGLLDEMSAQAIALRNELEATLLKGVCFCIWVG